MDDLKKKIEEFEKRLERIEKFLSSFPHQQLPLSYSYKDKDPLFDDAVKIACEYKQISSSLLQRRLQIGFNKAARILEQLEYEKIVEEGIGPRPRKVLLNSFEEYLSKKSN